MNGERGPPRPPRTFLAKYVRVKGLEVDYSSKFLIPKSRVLQKRHFMRVTHSVFANSPARERFGSSVDL